jgi:ATP-dependent Lhr-like helicase
MAVIQLYLEEKWIEPPEEKPLPFSLLIHQTFSILASLGEHSPAALARPVLALPPFKNISPEDFFTLTAYLTDCGCIGTTDERTLILGLEGERIVNRHSFYPVFPGDETFRVLLDGREIGTINFVPDPLSVLAVGGRRWTVKSIDPGRREIWVAETGDEGGERLWRGKGGGTHPRIAETMKRILTEPGGTAEYAYLSAHARKALENGRNAARALGLGNAPLISGKADAETNPGANFGIDGGTNSRTEAEADVVLLFPWTGSAGMRTIAAVLANEENKKQLKIVNLEEEAELYFRITTKLPLEEFRSAFIEVCCRALGTLSSLIRMEETPYTDKYDYLLPPALLAKQYAANMLDGKALETLVAKLGLY